MNYQFDHNDFGTVTGNGGWNYRVDANRLAQVGGSSEYDLGELTSTERTGDKVVRTYENGREASGCSRSATLTYTCGKTTRLISANEPRTCFYEIVAEVNCGSQDVCENGSCVYSEQTSQPPTCVCDATWYGDYCDVKAPIRVTQCNKDNGEVAIHAKLNFSPGGETYGEFDTNGEAVWDVNDAGVTTSFDNQNNLVLTKILGSADCDRVTVDGVSVCVDPAERLTFTCKYPLGDQTVTDAYQVTGQDTQTSAENTGTLQYSLEVDANTEIGDTVNFRITPVNSGLVAATIKHCNVEKASDQVTIIGHNADTCKQTSINVNDATPGFSSKSVINGSWTAFKWSTAITNNDAEDQSLVCVISLTQNIDATPAVPCQN